MTRTRTSRSSHAALDQYTECAESSAAHIISDYSTSFGMAARLLEPVVRPRIRSIYGLVRIADEIVDGAAEQAGLSSDERRQLLDQLARDTAVAMRSGFSANLVIHAFAKTARAVGIEPELVEPFFASMRRDTESRPMQADEMDTYIYGSAEVVGLMCLRVFVADHPTNSDDQLKLEDGARHLGAAFQKINFLRDLGDDFDRLGRNYFPALDLTVFRDTDKENILVDIERDLSIARTAMVELPRRSRVAVSAATRLFAALCDRIRDTPAATLRTTRVSVPALQKARILVAAQALDGRKA